MTRLSLLTAVTVMSPQSVCHFCLLTSPGASYFILLSLIIRGQKIRCYILECQLPTQKIFFLHYTMPKNKKKEESSSSSSDSDDGPVDRNPPPEKKAKMGDSRTNDKEPTWALPNKKFIKLREFKGKTYIDIREYYEKGGEMLPTKKGVSLNPEQWRKILSLSDEINEALSST